MSIPALLEASSAVSRLLQVGQHTRLSWKRLQSWLSGMLSQSAGVTSDGISLLSNSWKVELFLANLWSWLVCKLLYALFAIISGPHSRFAPIMDLRFFLLSVFSSIIILHYIYKVAINTLYELVKFIQGIKQFPNDANSPIPLQS